MRWVRQSDCACKLLCAVSPGLGAVACETNIVSDKKDSKDIIRGSRPARDRNGNGLTAAHLSATLTGQLAKDLGAGRGANAPSSLYSAPAAWLVMKLKLRHDQPCACSEENEAAETRRLRRHPLETRSEIVCDLLRRREGLPRTALTRRLALSSS